MKLKATDDVKLGLLADHYKDTNSLLEKLGKSRDRNFLYVLLLLGVMSFQLLSPNQSESILTQIVKSRLQVDATVSINLIGSLIWFGLLAVAIRYFQSVINLEKQYNYVHRLEAELGDSFDGEAFTREGKTYLKDYPKFSEWINFIYRIVFPIFLVVAITAKIVSELMARNTAWLPITLDSAIYLILLISTALYVYSLNRMNKDTEKDSK